MDRIAIFIDGAYLEKVLKEEFNEPKIDFEKLVREIQGNKDLLRTYYYHCLPYLSKQPTPEEQTRYNKRNRFYEALRYLPRFEVRLGKLAFRGIDQSGHPIFEQKRVDVLFARDVVLLAAKQQISTAFIITGDSDLIPALQTAKDEGVKIHLYHGSNPHHDLWRVADDRTQITQTLINKILLSP